MDLFKTVPGRRIFMTLSPRALPYARHALKSLLTNALESLSLRLITDSSSDKELLSEETARYPFDSRHGCEVFAKTDLDDHESKILGGYPNPSALPRWAFPSGVLQ